MRSSRGFASTALDLFALFRLAFASASPQSGLTLPITVSRRIIMQKARHHSWSTLRSTLLQCIDNWTIVLESRLEADSAKPRLKAELQLQQIGTVHALESPERKVD